MRGSDNLLIFIKNIFGFSISTKTLALISIASIFVFMVNTKLQAKQIYLLSCIISSLEKKNRGVSIGYFVIISILHCSFVTFIYFLRPILNGMIGFRVERILIVDSLKICFETFHKIGPSSIQSKISRTTSAIGNGAEILYFDLILNLIKIIFFFKNIIKLTERPVLIMLCLLILVYILIQIILGLVLKRIGRRKNESSELRFSFFKEYFTNFLIIKFSDQNKNLEKIINTTDNLNFKRFISLITLSNSIYFVFMNYFLIIYSHNFLKGVDLYNLIIDFNTFYKALNSFISKIFELESLRLDTMGTIIDDNHENFIVNENIKIDNNLNINNESDNDSNYSNIFSSTRYKGEKNENITKMENLDHSSMSVSRVETFEQKNLLYKNNNKLIDKQIHNKDYNIIINNGTVFVSGKVILSNINLLIKEGYEIALIGKNGSGKSTFLKYLLGFYKCKGTIMRNGEFLDDLRAETSFFSQNTIFDDDLIVAILKDEKGEEILKIARRFYLSNIAFKKAFTIQERTVITLIYISLIKSSIFIADEPIEHLDDNIKDKVLNFLLENVDSKIKIIVLHDLKYISKFNRVFLALNGEINDCQL